jgi:putative endonuclease
VAATIKLAAFYFSMHFTYILQPESTGRYYIGSTDNVERRVAQHNDPSYKGSKTTERFKGPWKLVYADSFQTRAEAMSREREIKSWKSRQAIHNLIISSDGRVPT